MYTIASLKQQHKTLAAAKTFHNLKAKSWAALLEKLNTPSIKSLQLKIDRLQSENTALKQQLAAAQTTESDYFVSPTAEIIYSIVKLDGEDRLKALGINRSHYKDPAKAKQWRNEMAAKVHPDKCTHPQAAIAIDEVTALYKNMVG
jgi:PhoPQ-activated pathogenicity-related protein